MQQTGTAAAVGKIYAPRLRWRRKGSAVANHAAAGTANKRGSGDDTADAAPSSSAGAAGAAPDWIQGLSGESPKSQLVCRGRASHEFERCSVFSLLMYYRSSRNFGE